MSEKQVLKRFSLKMVQNPKDSVESDEESVNRFIDGVSVPCEK